MTKLAATLKSTVSVIFILFFFLNLASATTLVVNLVSPVNSTNTSIDHFDFTFNPTLSDSGAGFTGASVWIANVTPLALGTSPVQWSQIGSNASALTNATSNSITVVNLPLGTYVWNVNVTTNTSSNFSTNNYTFTIDQGSATVSSAALVSQGAQILGFPAPFGVTFPEQLPSGSIKPIVTNVTFNITALESLSGVESVSVQNASGANGVAGYWVPATRVLGNATNSTWSVFLNFLNSTGSINATDGPINFTVNVTTFAGVSSLFNITGFGVYNSSNMQVGSDYYLDENYPGTPIQSFLGNSQYYINDWPLIVGRLFDEYSGQVYSNQNPSLYNASVVVSSFNSGQSGSSSYTHSYPVDQNGRFMISLTDPNALVIMGRQPGIYTIQGQVTGPNGIVSRASAVSSPQPLGFVAFPGRPDTNMHLYATPVEVLSVDVANATGSCTNFYGMIIDNTTMSPIVNFNNVSNASYTCSGSFVQAILPANKNYSLIVGNPPMNTQNGGFLVPPLSVPITTLNLSNNNYANYNGSMFNVSVNASYVPSIFNGSIFVTNSAGQNITCDYNSSSGMIDSNCVNFTSFQVFPIVAGLVPPMGAAAAENQTLLQNISLNNGPSSFYNTSEFNVSVLASPLYAVNYLAVAFATSNNTNYMGEAEFTASSSSATTMNFSLTALAAGNGTYNYNQTDKMLAPPGFNTSLTLVQLLNTTGGSISGLSNSSASNFQIVVQTNYSGIPVSYQYNTGSSSSFYVPLLANQPVTFQVFGGGFEPVEETFGPSVVNNNSTISIVVSQPRITAPPTGQGVNYSDTISTTNINFFVSNSTCNAPNFPSSCKLQYLSQSGSNASSFNPNQMQLSGTVNELVTETDTNTSTLFVGLDLSSNSIPNLQLNPAAQTSAGNNDFSKATVGSLIPHGDVQSIWVGVPIASGTNLNGVSVNIPVLYDDFGNVVWNSSVNTTNQIPSAYQDYVSFFNNSASNASDLSGINCYQIYNSSVKCWIDNSTSTATVWLNLPHFSSIQLQAQAPTQSTGSSGGSGGASAVSDTGYYYTNATTTTLAGVVETNSTASNSTSTNATTQPNSTSIGQTNNTLEQSAQSLIATAQSLLSQVKGNLSPSTLSSVNQLLNVANNDYVAGNYVTAQQYAQMALQQLQSPTTTSIPTEKSLQPVSQSNSYWPVIIVVVILALILGGIEMMNNKKKQKT